jgi:hypothetical protein
VTTDPRAIRRLAGALRRAGEGLQERRAVDVAASLGGAGRRFLDPADPLRLEALARLPEACGLSAPMCEAVLNGMAADWTTERFVRLLETELGRTDALERFVDRRGRTSMAVGPSLCVQIVSGSVPGVGVTALARSLLVKGPTLLKPGRGDMVLPELFARALREIDQPLADALGVVYWPGGSEECEDAALVEADVVTVYGSDETVKLVRARLPATTRLLAYHHRVSVGLVGRDALTRSAVARTADDVAFAVALFDRRGCVSPQLVWVEEGGEVDPERFADELARALAQLEARLPSGTLGAGEAVRLQQARGTAELLEGVGALRVRHGGSSGWTVVLEKGAGPGREERPNIPGTAVAPSAPGRFVRLWPVADLGEVPSLLQPLGVHLQTVGITGAGPRLEALAMALGRVGASRVTPFAAVPFPPPWWHHDGRGPLRDLVRWVDLEQG